MPPPVPQLTDPDPVLTRVMISSTVRGLKLLLANSTIEY